MVTTMDSLTVQIGADVKPFEASLGRISSDFDGLDSKLSALSNKIDSIKSQSASLVGNVSEAALAVPLVQSPPQAIKEKARATVSSLDHSSRGSRDDDSFHKLFKELRKEVALGIVEGATAGAAAGLLGGPAAPASVPSMAVLGGLAGGAGRAAAFLLKEADDRFLDPDLEEQLSSALADLESAEEEVAQIENSLRDVRTLLESDSVTDPIEKFNLESEFKQLKVELERNQNVLANAQNELQTLLNEFGSGGGAESEVGLAVDGLSEKLSVDLTDAIQQVNDKWPEFSRIAIENLDKVEQKAGSLADTLNGLRAAAGGASARDVGTETDGGIEIDSQLAEGGPVFPGGTFLVGERGPELFVPSTAGTIIPNSALGGRGGFGGSGGDLGAGIARLTAELQRLSAILQQASAGQAQFAAFSAMSGQSLAGLQGVLAQTQGGLAATGVQAAQVGTAIEEALGGLPEEFGLVADALDGVLNEALSGNIRSWGGLREAALGAAREVLGGILQSEEVRGEIGELADVIDGVLNQALSGSIDSWEDLGRVALDVLQQIATEILKTQLAGQGGGGGGIFGAIGSFLGIVGGFFGGGGGGGPGSGTTGVGSASVGVTAQVPFAPQNFAGGGLVTGPGSGTSDSIPARLSNGEFVVNAASSREHRGLLQAINSGAVPTINDPGFLGTPVQPAGRSTTVNISIDARGAERGVGEEIAQALVARIDKLDREIEPRAAAEVIRRANRGGDFARGIGRRP